MPPLELKLNKPCNDCPYRKDAPLRKWAKEEFDDLIANSNNGTAYGCHKQNGSYCIGWLVSNKRLNDDYETARSGIFPTLSYTVTFAKLRLNGLEWRLDEIDENTPELYHTVQEMALENYDNTQL